MRKPKSYDALPSLFSKKIRWSGPPLDEIAGAKYPSILSAEPDEQRLQRLAKLETEYREGLAAALIESMGKLHELRQHYNIDNDDIQVWPLMLCLRICMDIFPGFEIEYENKRGRKKSFGLIEQASLIAEIEEIKGKSALTDGDACRELLLAKGIKRPSEAEIRNQQNRLSKARQGPMMLMFTRLGKLDCEGGGDRFVSLFIKHFGKAT